MKSNFDPHSIEQPLYQEWEAQDYFAPTGNGQGYSIAIPPPNITGNLHMGHAFQNTLMDVLTRYHRMKGDRTLWQMGTDHAGIATQMLIERALNAEGKTRYDIGREAFLDRVWEWREESGGNICQQLRRMGSSVDWNTERFTLDEGFSNAVLEVFVRLYEEDLIYRGQRLVNWDPQLESAISDLEVENEEEQGHLWHLRYPLNDGLTGPNGDTWLVVATTRPETMLGDTAVAVHPDDERYQHLIGAAVRLPLAERDIPIIADEYVDPEFGSGCVKITPAHDFNDNEVGERHGLDLINVMTQRAAINDNAPQAYRGLDRYDARERIVADLDALGLLAGVEDHKLQVPRGDRSGAVIEPLLTDQWFVRIEPLARPAIEAVESGAIEFVPKQYENLYFSWMRNIQDWCISRQQWWGHRIPAWYDEAGNIYVGRSEAEARENNGLGEDVALRQDEDVLETWFSSSLWTFATLGWPGQTEALEKFHPTSVLVTGHDIMFFWVARMIMMTLKFTGEIPFRQVHIHGLVRDADGNKMSKTKGNGLDPLDLIDGVTIEELVTKRTVNLTQPQMAGIIEKKTRKEFPDGIPSYGTDALRFTYCALASTGHDLRFDLNRIEGYRNFCNKLWNASRYALMNTEDAELEGPAQLGLADRWIRSQAHHLIQASALAIDTYRFDLYANTVYEFVWREYCDWYVELTKPVLWDENADAAIVRGTRRTLLEVLELLLRVAHPIMPYITETIWREVAPRLGKQSDTIMLQPFPGTGDVAQDADADEAVEWLKDVVVGVRNIRGEANIKPGQEVNLLLQGGSERDHELACHSELLVKKLAKAGELSWIDDDAEPPANALALVGELRVMVPLEGLIDVAAEIKRLDKEIQKREKELARVGAKLGNPNFIDKAPPEVVDKEHAKAADIESALAALRDQRASFD
ncbi:MAG: valine--tRNA ligase [Pseudomonadales bacterium]|nr:valine--tRNA ligase [Pseudomonadales bacterium]MDP6471614.1 valine--tRNA ligase [Pseudomonadales bacterium]MDP6828877.1 valine--tRNA ligase [Pseudomonadales bacterium]